MPEPDWNARLETQLSNLAKLYPEAEGLSEVVRSLVTWHRVDAHDAGWLANRSKAGYRLVSENEKLRRELELSKRKEDPCPTAAPSAGTPSPASSTEGDEPWGSPAVTS
jgi:hypothetical protein